MPVFFTLTSVMNYTLTIVSQDCCLDMAATTVLSTKKPLRLIVILRLNDPVILKN